MAERTTGRKLSLVDAVAMAIGGMVGGGIFAVLGQSATAAGNGARAGRAEGNRLPLTPAGTATPHRGGRLGYILPP